MFSIHLTPSATTRSHWNFFSAFKELFRFILTTIILTHSSGVTAASIINNYKSSAATSVKRSRKMDPFGVGGGSCGRACQRAEHVNLWNFRTFSSLSVSQHTVPVSASTVTEQQQQQQQQQHGSQRSRRSNANSDSKAMVQSVARSNVSSTTKAEATRPPTVQEMKAQLGPLGQIVATAVEVGITTAGSYLSGGVFGYVWGGVSGSPSLFKPLENAGGGAQPQRKFAQLQSKLASLNGAACTQAKSWGELSAAFSGCHALTRCVRGGKEDRWNSIVGSGLAGAYLNKGAGVQGMLQGGMTYASFTYVIDFVFGSSSGGGKGGGGGGGGRGGSDNRQFEFQDTPLIEEQARGY
jgi:hypothetical protein